MEHQQHTQQQQRQQQRRQEHSQQQQQQQQHLASKEPLACDSVLDSFLQQANASPQQEEQPAKPRLALHRAHSMASGSPAAASSCQGEGEGEAGGRGREGPGPNWKGTQGHMVSRSLGSDTQRCSLGDPKIQAQTPLPSLGESYMDQSRAGPWGMSAGGAGEGVEREAAAMCGPGGALRPNALSPAEGVARSPRQGCSGEGLLEDRVQHLHKRMVVEQRDLEASNELGLEGSEERVRGRGPLQWPEFRQGSRLGDGCPAAAALEPESAPEWQSGDGEEDCPSSRFLGCSWKELIPNPVVRARLREFDLLNAANSAGSSPRRTEGLERCATTQPALLNWALSSLHSEAPGSPLVRTLTMGPMGLRTPRCGTPVSTGGTPGGSSDVSPVLRRRVTASRTTVIDDCWLTGPERQRKWEGGIVVDELEQHRREDVAKFLDDFSGIPGMKRKRI